MNIEQLTEGVDEATRAQLRGAFLSHASGPWLAALAEAFVRPIDLLAQASPSERESHLALLVPSWFLNQAIRIVDWALAHPGEALPIPSLWRDMAACSLTSPTRMWLDFTRHLGIPTTYGEIPAELTTPRWARET